MTRLQVGTIPKCSADLWLNGGGIGDGVAADSCTMGAKVAVVAVVLIAVVVVVVVVDEVY
jgi:hypothetical protein